VKPTTASSLAAVWLVGAVLAYSGELVLVRVGEPLITPPTTLAVALVLLGMIIPLLAWPVRQVTRSETKRAPVDPFYATRVLLVSKAGSLTASALAGGGVGVVVFLLGRMVVVWPQVVVSVLTIAGGIIMLVGALVAERWCVLPPTDGGESSGVSEGEPA